MIDPESKPRDTISSCPAIERRIVGDKATDKILEKLQLAQVACDRAKKAHNRLAIRDKKKTMASNGCMTISGTKNSIPSNIKNKFTDSEKKLKREYTTEELLENFKNLEGYTLTGGGSNDDDFNNPPKKEVVEIKKPDGSVVKKIKSVRKRYPGSSAACHAEKQLIFYHEMDSIESIETPIGVSKVMCGDCRNFFRAKSCQTNKEIFVADPKSIRVFKPNGKVDIYDKEYKLLRVINEDEKPKVGLNNYENELW